MQKEKTTRALSWIIVVMGLVYLGNFGFQFLNDFKGDELWYVVGYGIPMLVISAIWNPFVRDTYTHPDILDLPEQTTKPLRPWQRGFRTGHTLFHILAIFIIPMIFEEIALGALIYLGYAPLIIFFAGRIALRDYER